VIPIPPGPDVLHVGAVDERQKFDALAAAALLVMPSFYESLSMVLLEAWALHKPVMVNAHCDVLRGQVERSNGGLHYGDAGQFVESLGLLLADQRLREACGAAGHDYFASNYRWPVIAAKYEKILRELSP
jgi:glycosyltransferase involved in cell wall biosynthesis